MRILIDTNIIIPLEDSRVNIDEKLAKLNRQASGKHQLLIHPESYKDIQRDKNEERKHSMLLRLGKYLQLESPPVLINEEENHLFGAPKKENDYVDNRILYSLYKHCVHWLITEDEGIHRKAKKLGLGERVFTVEQVIGTLDKLDGTKVNLFPNISDVACHTIDLKNKFFDSLREGYSGFNDWFNKKCCQDGRRAWICQNGEDLYAICIYKREFNEVVTLDGISLSGGLLKICTFKVALRGYKIGELLLKQCFTYASDNNLKYAYVTVDPSDHGLLRELLIDFGFSKIGLHLDGRDEVFVKEFPKPPLKTEDGPLEYAIKYFPTIKLLNNATYLVPIKPQYHSILFPEIQEQQDLFLGESNSAGNAIKQAYLCKTPNKSIKPGDILFFYRTQDSMSITSYGIVEQFEIEHEEEKIFQWVAKRTVYSYDEISSMVHEGKAIKVILFRLVGHFKIPVSYQRLKDLSVISAPIQSVISTTQENTKLIFKEAELDDCFISN
jgi:rRNA-processing protein FCF1